MSSEKIIKIELKEAIQSKAISSGDGNIDKETLRFHYRILTTTVLLFLKITTLLRK